jgi:3-oxosteroid 1-dehydrogenase
MASPRVSGGGGWFPNNPLMQRDGHEDPRDWAIKYMTRYSLPHVYNPDDAQFGLSDDDFALFSRYYDTAAEAVQLLEDQGAITWTYGEGFGPHFDQVQIDYMEEYEENKAPFYRTLHPTSAEGTRGSGGDMIGGYQAWAEANGVSLSLNHRVDHVITNTGGDVIGVEITITTAGASSESATPEASPVAEQTIAVRARKGVIFGSGGFARNQDMMRHFMPAPHYGGCSAPTNEGDLLRISAALGAKLGNLHNTWRNEGLFEQAVADTGAYNCIFIPSGDSYIQVNKHGKRFMNEKRNYQDRPMAHFDWDPNYGDWTSRLSFYVYDQRVQDNWGGSFPFPQDPSTAPYVIMGDTLEDLAAAIDERVASLTAVTGNLQLDAEFATNLVAEVAKFNEFATIGEDLDFRRGALAYDVTIPMGPTSPEATLTEYPSADQANVAMYPLSAEGPYYAFVISASAVDTNGGPVINPDAQIVRWDGTAIEGLYGAGNCIANPGVNAYWGGGATIGNGHVWGYNAALHAVASAEKSAS